MKNIVAHDPLRINLSILNSFSVKHVYFTNGIGDWSSVTIITDESWQCLQLCNQGTHHLPTWEEPLALWSLYHYADFSLTSILGRWLLQSSQSLFDQEIDKGARNRMHFPQILYFSLHHLYLEYVFLNADLIRWCFTPSLSSPWLGNLSLWNALHIDIMVVILEIFLFFRCLLWFALATDLPEQHPRVSVKVIVGLDVIVTQRTAVAWTSLAKVFINFLTVIIVHVIQVLWKFGMKTYSMPSQERQLILENRTFDPAVSEKQLQGKVLPLIRDMLCNRWNDKFKNIFLGK